MAKKKYKAKKLERGKYLYRGYIIEYVGYVSPLLPKAWQAHDGQFLCFPEQGSLREAKEDIDNDLDKEE